MRRFLNRLPLLITVLIIGVIYGVMLHRNHVFPYRYIKIVYNCLIPVDEEKPKYGPWSIGLYEGPTPFDLANPKDISNPVLSGEDVSDIDGRFVADPFMLIKNDKYFLFFEVLNRQTNHGDIGYAISLDGMNWKYKKIIIDEPFHLSYPYIFEWDDNIYLIPESSKDYSVRIYKALFFPEKWEYMGNILNGYRYKDPSVFRYGNKWWMFVSTTGSECLNLYYSDRLLKDWRPHPMNPVVKLDKHYSRPAGRVLNYNGNLYRFTQDDYPSYGIQVFAFKINELSDNSYMESMASEKPIVKLTGEGWNAAGMHHVDIHRQGDKWMAIVDGRSR